MGILSGKVAIVTGARSNRGIGYSTALQLAKDGADVVMTSRFAGHDAEIDSFQGDSKFQEFQALAESIEQLGGRCLAVPMDVTNRDQVAKAIDYTCEKLGGLDILFNNAGVGYGTPFVDTPLEEFEQSFAVNFMGVVNTNQLAVAQMIKRGGGAIINNASIYGLGAEPFFSAYIASKHAVIGLTKAMAVELGQDGIRVNAVCPGMIVTEMGDVEYQAVADIEGVSFEEAKAMIANKNVFCRGGRPEEVADAVSFLASERAGFITGIAMPVAGGQSPGL
jgi:NAD(P)-dependent dehydrogenase (short-subunit alcohol dehydrogenase family)